MFKMIQEFFGGDKTVREKLNELVRAVNSVMNIRGDETFISVNHAQGTSGLAIGLNINQVLSRIPKQYFSGAFAVQVKVDSATASLTGSMALGQTVGFTYSLFDLSANALKDSSGANITGKTPQVYRVTNCAYHKPADNSLGIAYRDASGVIQLYDAAQERIPGTTINSYEDSIDGSGNLVKTPTSILVLDKANVGSPVTLVAACP